MSEQKYLRGENALYYPVDLKSKRITGKPVRRFNGIYVVGELHFDGKKARVHLYKECGSCKFFRDTNYAKHRKDPVMALWQGSCKKLKVGRNPDSLACGDFEPK